MKTCATQLIKSFFEIHFERCAKDVTDTSQSAVPLLFGGLLQPLTVKHYQVTSVKVCEGSGLKALGGE